MFANKVLQTITSTGTGAYQLNSTGTGGWKTFRSQFATAAQVAYFAENSDGTIWEFGYGTLTYGTPDQISRNYILSSTGSLIDWTSGDGTVYVMSVPLAQAMEGRWDATAGMFAPAGRKPYTAVGAANKTVTVADAGGRFSLDNSAAPRTVALPAISAVSMGFNVEVFGLSQAYAVLLDPAGTDALDGVSGGAAVSFPGQVSITVYSDGTQWRTNYAYSSATVTPGGRLTLATGVPVMTSDQTAKTTIYYTPQGGNNVVPIYNGAQWVLRNFAELSNDTTASSTGKAGPAAVTTNSNYDLFVWDDAGTLRLTRGPAWTSDTARGTGAGTSELTRINGIPVNANAITNGPAANCGTFVGTVRSDGSSKINWQAGAIAANGTAAILGVWNMYNRRLVSGMIGDTTDSWTYSGGVFRSANASNTMRASFIQGLQEDSFSVRYDSAAQANSAQATVAIGLDSTSAVATGSTRGTWSPGATNNLGMFGAMFSTQSIGWHYCQAIELNVVGSAVFYGDGGVVYIQTGMSYAGWF